MSLNAILLNPPFVPLYCPPNFLLSRSYTYFPPVFLCFYKVKLALPSAKNVIFLSLTDISNVSFSVEAFPHLSEHALDLYYFARTCKRANESVSLI